MSLDAEVFDYLTFHAVPTCNGTAALQDWGTTRLARHVQHALMEKHIAAATLASAGLDVLVTDSTQVFKQSVLPFFRSQSPEVNIYALRASCNAAKEPLGCRWVRGGVS
jgi:hypothetical protein